MISASIAQDIRVGTILLHERDAKLRVKVTGRVYLNRRHPHRFRLPVEHEGVERYITEENSQCWYIQPKARK